MSRFAENIKALRSELSLTKTDLAKLTGLSRQQITRWEAGAAAPQLANLRMLANLFGLSVADLQEGDLSQCDASDFGYGRDPDSRAADTSRAKVFELGELDMEEEKGFRVLRRIDHSTTLARVSDRELVYELALRYCKLAVEAKAILDEVEQINWEAVAEKLDQAEGSILNKPRAFRPAVDVMAMLYKLTEELTFRFSVFDAVHELRFRLPLPDDVKFDDIKPGTASERLARIYSRVNETRLSPQLYRLREEELKPVGDKKELLSALRRAVAELKKSLLTSDEESR